MCTTDARSLSSAGSAARPPTGWWHRVPPNDAGRTGGDGPDRAVEGGLGHEVRDKASVEEGAASIVQRGGVLRTGQHETSVPSSFARRPFAAQMYYGLQLSTCPHRSERNDGTMIPIAGVDTPVEPAPKRRAEPAEGVVTRKARDPVVVAAEHWRAHGWETGWYFRSLVCRSTGPTTHLLSNEGAFRPHKLTRATPRGAGRALLLPPGRDAAGPSRASAFSCTRRASRTTVDTLERLGLVERVATPERPTGDAGADHGRRVGGRWRRRVASCPTPAVRTRRARVSA